MIIDTGTLLTGILAILVASVPALITAFVTIRATAHTQQKNNEREAQRLEHELKMKIREERQKAYATMARITKGMEVSDPLDISDLAEVHAEIEMLTEDRQLLDAAGELLHAASLGRQHTAKKEQNPANPFLFSRFEEAKAELDRCRTVFINLARKELGLKPSPTRNREEEPETEEEGEREHGGLAAQGDRAQSGREMREPPETASEEPYSTHAPPEGQGQQGPPQRRSSDDKGETYGTSPQEAEESLHPHSWWRRFFGLE